MIRTYQELYDHLAFQGFTETRNEEFKKGLRWTELKYLIAKAIMALSNLQDGGTIIVGIDEDEHGRYTLNGMSKETSQTFKIDDIMSFVNEYAEPPTELSLNEIQHQGKYFILINVHEFAQQPTICKKDYLKDGKKYLQKGRIYYRPKKKIESTDDLSYHDMRELMDFATEKYHFSQIESCEKFKSLESTKKEKVDTKTFFDNEVAGF